MVAYDASAAARLTAVVARLRSRSWQPDAVARVLPWVALQLPGAPLAVRAGWQVALREGWPDLCRQRGERDVVFPLGVLAAALAQWRTARDCFAASLAFYGEHPATHYNLAAACWQLARYRLASYHAARAAQLAPCDARFADGARALADWRAWCRRHVGKESLRDAASGMRVTPLGPHHAAALARRHADSDGQPLARLRVLRGDADAANWIREQQHLRGATSLALIDPDDGLSGILGLEQRGNLALFHYWLASQFRGAGRGHGVVRLLLAAARQRGVSALYSPVHTSNAASLAVLRHGGFLPLGTLGERCAGNGRLMYYWRPVGMDGMGRRDAAAALQSLLHATGHAAAVQLPGHRGEMPACW